VPVDPSTLAIVLYPDPVLRRRGADVPAVTDEVRRVAARMIELMFEAEGIGLAAPQVGLPWRMFVAHVPPTDQRSTESDPPTATAGPTVYINPVLSGSVGEPVLYEEGCLSLPDIRGDILRPERIAITATDLEGKRFTRTGAGLLARCWQHEYDHLDGVLILDRMSQMSRLKNRSSIRRMERESRL
jgi:peptide deformylase